MCVQAWSTLGLFLVFSFIVGTKQVADQYQPIETTTEFYSMEDLSTDVYIHKVMLPASDVGDDPFATDNGFSDHPITR